MAKDWGIYQEKVAAVFRRLGAKAELQVHVAGARGEHDVDVWVTFDKFGVNVRWLVECKLWKTAVPKEKVAALYEIAQDVGADRALLFSESGFQAGAIKASANTNVSLTNLAEFESYAEQELYAATLVQMITETEKLHSEVKSLWIDDNGRLAPIPGLDLDQLIGLDGAILFFKLALQKALTGAFPISYPAVSDCSPVVSHDGASFLQNARSTLETVRQCLDKLAPAYEQIMGTTQQRVGALVLSVQELIAAAKTCLFERDQSEKDFERDRFQALGKMKAVDRAAQALYAIPDDEIHVKVRSLIKLLIDTVYLYLTLPTVPRGQWCAATDTVENLLTDIKSL
jgi:hypothetical protein